MNDKYDEGYKDGYKEGIKTVHSKLLKVIGELMDEIKEE